MIGPGIITANVDNDAGGITTYSVAGAHYGYSLLWMMPLVALALIIVQEMSARLGVVTGKGLADLIRESLGVRAHGAHPRHPRCSPTWRTRSASSPAWRPAWRSSASASIISVPIAAVVVWLLIVKGNYKSVERIFLVASAIYLAYVVSGILARPPWGESCAQPLSRPTSSSMRATSTIFVTIIGTTIAPWMQFYQQASIVDKGLKVTDYAYERIDVVVGSLFAVFVACFIMIACAATLYQQWRADRDGQGCGAGAAARWPGRTPPTLFALGLLNASVFSAAILPLSTAYVVCEAFGWESGVNRGWREAPVFFSIYTALIVLGAADHPAAHQVAGAGRCWPARR